MPINKEDMYSEGGCIVHVFTGPMTFSQLQRSAGSSAIDLEIDYEVILHNNKTVMNFMHRQAILEIPAYVLRAIRSPSLTRLNMP
jgi:hypothetical protein